MALHEGGFRRIMLYPTPKLVAITSNLFVLRHALMPQVGEGDGVLELKKVQTNHIGNQVLQLDRIT